MSPAAPQEIRAAGQARLTRRTAALVWLTVAGAAVVFVEPAPFWLLLMVFCAGGYLGLAIAQDFAKAFVWTSVTLFLAVAGAFFAVYVSGDRAARARLILNAYTFAAVLAALVAIVGYFGKIGAFMLYDRASGTFKDPNVLGSFLALPAAYMIMLALERPLRRALLPGLVYGILSLGVLLTFSRGAWGLLAFSSLATGYLAFVTARSTGRRARMALIGLVGCALLVAGLMVLLSFQSIGEFLKARASLEQSYDSQHLGRFERHALGFILALERPLGVGPHEFSKFFPEDPHNVYLNGLMSYGWIGGLAYLGLVIWTLAKGLRLALTAGPRLRLYAIPIAATFLGIALEGIVIDTDHWRHFYLLAGLVWGLSATSRGSYGRMEPRPDIPAALEPLRLRS